MLLWGWNSLISLAGTLFSTLLVGVKEFPVSNIADNSIYDFVVVGSGSAGSVVAGRLSEVPEWEILILEAGGQPSALSRIPAMSLYAMPEFSPWSWGYKTTPQKYSQFNYDNNRNLFPRGKVIGGTSAVNFMMYNRGSRHDFDAWADLGNPGWDYKTVLNYFKKSENYTGKMTQETEQYHGHNGPVTVSNKKWGTPVMQAFLAAGIELGYPTIDNNGPHHIGFSTPDLTVTNGLRSSLTEAFIRPRLGKNLNLLHSAYVTKIILDDKKAIGVRFLHRNQMKQVFVRKEVIVCAGAIESPKLLLLSGIGPRQHLNQIGIKTIVDLPGVGQNFQDHPSVWGMTWTVNDRNSSSFRTILNPSALRTYIGTRSGPLSVPHGIEGNAWTRLQSDDPGPSDLPNMQFLIVALTISIDYGLLIAPAVGIRRDVYNEMYGPIEGRSGFSIGPMLTRPKSRGSITLRSTNPLDHPNLDPNFLSHPDDVEMFLKGVRFALSIGNSTAMRTTLNAKFLNTHLPGCKHLAYDSDDYWRCFIRRMTSSTYHPVGTCKMSPDADEMGVVSHSLKVKGVQGLRVIDASIMPIITTANTNAPVIMIGERGADFIKQDYSAL